MQEDLHNPHHRYQRLVQRVLRGSIPRGVDFDSCRAVLVSDCEEEVAHHALCTLLEGALADPSLNIDDTQDLVPLLRELARGSVAARDLL